MDYINKLLLVIIILINQVLLILKVNINGKLGRFRGKSQEDAEKEYIDLATELISKYN